MHESYLQEHFDRLVQASKYLSYREKFRIDKTLKLVPANWKSVIDVGCGDGRVSASLLASGCRVVGIDWSAVSIERFAGEKYACDIRAEWPIAEKFDGAICCEVLEHLEPFDAMRVITQIRAHVIRGLLITVPEREVLDDNTVVCDACGQAFHVWGHIQRFERFSDVDELVGLKSSVQQRIVPKHGCRPWRLFGTLRRRMGVRPTDSSYLCPHCGAPLQSVNQLPLLKRYADKAISFTQHIFSPFCGRRGWLACRYDI